jgi:hypothetical protein
MVEKRNYIVVLPGIYMPIDRDYRGAEGRVSLENVYSEEQAIGGGVSKVLGRRNIGLTVNQIKQQHEDFSNFAIDVKSLEVELMKDSAERNTRISNMKICEAISERIGGSPELYRKVVGDYLIDNPVPRR